MKKCINCGCEAYSEMEDNNCEDWEDVTTCLYHKCVIAEDDLIRGLRDEIKLLKGAIDYINPTNDSVEEIIKDYTEYMAGFN